MKAELKKYMDFFYEFSGKLVHKEFPVRQIPVGDVKAILMNFYWEQSKWLDIKLRFLENLIRQEDYDGCALFFYEIAENMQVRGNISDIQLLNSYKEKAGHAFRNKILSEYADNKWFKGKGVVYTVITGNYVALKDPDYVSSELDYICFTDNVNVKSRVWQIRKLTDTDNIGIQGLSRKPKILMDEFLGEYKYSIYIDGKFKIKGNLYEYINKYSMGAPMLCFPHYARDCIYDEAEICILTGKDKESVIRGQVEQYKTKGLPTHNGLVDAGCMVRAHGNKIVNAVMNDWWKEFSNGCCRDQISFPYACWKNKFKYDICDLFINDNEYITMER